MNNIPTYYDLKYANTSKIFEAEEIKDLSPDEILEGEKAYKIILEKLEKGEPIDEGFLSGLLGGGAAALVGPALMRSICKVLGVDEKGTLGKLLCSRLVLAAIGYSIAK